MRKKRILSMTLMICMLIGIMPQFALSVKAEENPGHVYTADLRNGDLIVSSNKITYVDFVTGERVKDAPYSPEDKIVATTNYGHQPDRNGHPTGYTTGYRIIVDNGDTPVNLALSNLCIDFKEYRTEGYPIQLKGTSIVNLFLEGDQWNFLYGGDDGTAINVPTGTSLTIDGEGKLIASTYYSKDKNNHLITAAAIGGSSEYTFSYPLGEGVGNITIKGGTIIASGYTGIGSGYGVVDSIDDPGTIKITGGNVTVDGYNGGDGIGGQITTADNYGRDSGRSPNIIITGGTVTATEGEGGEEKERGAAIGSSTGGGTIKISGGTINATAIDNGVAIGGWGTEKNPEVIEISGGDITVKAKMGPKSAWSCLGGPTGIGTTENRASTNLSITISGGTINANTVRTAIGGYVEGLSSSNIIKISGGDITAESTYGGAGIGYLSNRSSHSNRNNLCHSKIEISGGTIKATGKGGAGIGGGKLCDGGDILISGGDITATSNAEGAGIGSGGDFDTRSGYYGIPRPDMSGNANSITITGGIVRATGANSAAGIGGSTAGRGGTVRITGGTVTAIGGSVYIYKGGYYKPDERAPGIGGGYSSVDNEEDKDDTREGECYVSGGSVYVSSMQPKKVYRSDEKKQEVYLTTVGLKDVTKPLAVTDLTTVLADGALYDYGTKDMYTDKDGKLYLWLPEASVTSSIQGKDNAYTGSITTNKEDPSEGTFELNPYAIVSTLPISDITPMSASVGGNVTSENGSPITERGVVYSTDANPTVTDNKIKIDGTTGKFTTKLEKLTPKTTYHVRAYAVNGNGTGYGQDISFTTEEIKPAQSVDVSPNTNTPVAGENNETTLTVKDSLGSTDTTFTGPKDVTISGAAKASDDTYGNFNGMDLTSDSNSTGQTVNVTFDKGVGKADLALNKAEEQTITFNVEDVAKDGSVDITPTVGKLAKMEIAQDVLAPTKNGEKFAQQPVVALTDQFGNLCKEDSLTKVTASRKDEGNWTLTGTTTATADKGIVTFTDLGAENSTKISDAQIAFNASDLKEVTSKPIVLSTENAPLVPTMKWAVAGDGNVEVAWNKVTGAKGYKLFKSTESKKYTTPVTTVSGSVYHYNVSGLTNDIPYYFVVRAINDEGESNYSNEISATPKALALGAPILNVGKVGDSHVDITWKPVEKATDYKIYQSTTAGTYSKPVGTVTDAVYNYVYNYRAANLTNGTIYYFVVKAVNKGGESDYSNEVSAIPEALTYNILPKDKVITSKDESSINIQGTGNKNDTIWIAPAGTTTFKEGDTMSKVSGDSDKINVPSADGEYRVYVIDKDGHVSKPSDTKVIVDRTAPTVSGVEDGKTYDDSRTITFSDGSAKLNGKDFTNGGVVEENGEYTLVVTDKYGNSTTIKFTIDKKSDGGDEGSKDTTIITDKGKVDDTKLKEAIEAAKTQNKGAVTIKVKQEVTDNNPIEISISKDEVDHAKNKNINLVVETDNTSIEVPISAVDTSDMDGNSRLKLICEQVDTEALENKEMVQAVKKINKDMGIYKHKIFDFSVIKVEEDGSGKVIREEVIHFTSDKDIHLGIFVGAVENNNTLMTFYYNPSTKEWEYVRGKYQKSSGEIDITTRHLSTYSVMTLTPEQKREELTKLINDPDITVPEIRYILEDEDMKSALDEVDKYNSFDDQHKNETAQGIIDGKKTREDNKYKDYNDLEKEFNTDVDKIYSRIHDNSDGSSHSTSSSSGGAASKTKNTSSIEILKGKEDLTVKEASEKGLSPKDEDMKLISDVYTVSGTKENIDGQIQITYDESKVENEDHLAVFVYDSEKDQWNCLGGVVDKDKNTVTVKMDQEGKIAVIELTKTFKDLDGHWAQDIIETLAARQIITGDGQGHFNPNMGITRAEFATLISKMLHLPLSGTDTGFTDVAPDDWFAPYSTAARKAGIIKGVSETEYEPDRIVNREEMTAIVMRAYQYAHGTEITDEEINQEPKFVDSDKIGDWAYKNVYGAKHLHLVQGRDHNTFMPQDETTKAEAAVLVYRFLKVLNQI